MPFRAASASRLTVMSLLAVALSPTACHKSPPQTAPPSPYDVTLDARLVGQDTFFTAARNRALRVLVIN